MRLTEEKLNAINARNRARKVTPGDVIVPQKPKQSKYRAVKVDLDGRTFDSKKERDRYIELKHLAQAGVIKDLKFQPRYVLSVKGHEICAYVGDFLYQDLKGKERLEDVKGYKGGQAYALFRIKKKLMFALHNIDVEEV